MQIVSVINYKGGVGNTTLTANLGAYAASRGKRVLLIDADPQTQLTFNFISVDDWKKLFSRGKTLKNFFKPLTKGNFSKIAPLSDYVISVHAGTYDIDIVSSHLELIDTDMAITAAAWGPSPDISAQRSLCVFTYFLEALGEVSENYDLVLIDCPPNFYSIVKMMLLASDYYIIPARLDYLSKLGIDNLQSSINRLLKQYDKFIEIADDDSYSHICLLNLGVVPMMVSYSKGDELINANEEILKELEMERYNIFPSIRNNSSVFAKKPEIGLPIVLTKPRSFFQASQRKIVEELKILGDKFLETLKF